MPAEKVLVNACMQTDVIYRWQALFDSYH